MALTRFLNRLGFEGDRADVIQFWIAVVLQLVILFFFVSALWDGRWLLAFTAAIVFTLTFMPSVIEWQFGIYIPVEFILINTLFLFASFALGEVRAFYLRIWWWDLLLHGFSAIIMGIVGFLFVYVFYSEKKIEMQPLFIGLFSFSFAVSLGVLWELFEFLMDHFFGTNMMKSGLDDTMTDLMMDVAGAFVASMIGYWYVRGESFFFVDRIVRKLIKSQCPKEVKSKKN